MPANTEPIYTATPKVEFCRVTAQQVSSGRGDGTGTVGTDIFLAFSAGSNGSYLKEMRIKEAGAAAGASGAASNIRIYLSSVNTGSATSTNTKLIAEVAVPALTVSSTTAPTPDFMAPLNFAIPSGMYLLVGSGAALGSNCEFQCSTFGGDY